MVGGRPGRVSRPRRLEEWEIRAPEGTADRWSPVPSEASRTRRYLLIGYCFLLHENGTAVLQAAPSLVTSATHRGYDVTVELG